MQYHSKVNMETFWLGILTSALSEKSTTDWLILQLMKIPFWPLKRVSKHAKMVKANNFPHSYPKIGVSKLHNATLPHLPSWQKAENHRFFSKKQSGRNTLYSAISAMFAALFLNPISKCGQFYSHPKEQSLRFDPLTFTIGVGSSG